MDSGGSREGSQDKVEAIFIDMPFSLSPVLPSLGTGMEEADGQRAMPKKDNSTTIFGKWWETVVQSTCSYLIHKGWNVVPCPFIDLVNNVSHFCMLTSSFFLWYVILKWSKFIKSEWFFFPF